MTDRIYRILLVEDNPADAYIVGEALKIVANLTVAASHFVLAAAKAMVM